MQQSTKCITSDKYRWRPWKSHKRLQLWIQSNITKEYVSFSTASMESRIEIQEFIHSNLKLLFTSLMDYVVMKYIQLPCTAKEPPLDVAKSSLSYPQHQQNRYVFSYRISRKTLQDMVCIILAQKQYREFIIVNCMICFIT